MPDAAPTATSAKLYAASDLARFCQADISTIHKWCDKGKVVHQRTPGGHLRFRAPDVIAFLNKYGYELPPELKADAS